VKIENKKAEHTPVCEHPSHALLRDTFSPKGRRDMIVFDFR
jgi:hypothetical protein